MSDHGHQTVSDVRKDLRQIPLCDSYLNPRTQIHEMSVKVHVNTMTTGSSGYIFIKGPPEDD